MGLACLVLSIINGILVSCLWDGPGMPGPVYYKWKSWCLVSGMGLACLGLSSITRILVSGLWDGPGMPGAVYYKLNSGVLSLGWAWHAWTCLL